LIQLHFLYFS